MRRLRAATGPFQERPYFKDAEIERICLDALREVNLLPTSPEPIRVDRFIEKRFGVPPKYEDLPGGLLGLTIFTSRTSLLPDRLMSRPRLWRSAEFEARSHTKQGTA